MKRSIVKRPNLESLSGSPLAARRKRIRESAGNIEIENVVIDFPFLIAYFSSLHVAVTRLCMVKFVYAERLAL